MLPTTTAAAAAAARTVATRFGMKSSNARWIRRLSTGKIVNGSHTRSIAFQTRFVAPNPAPWTTAIMLPPNPALSFCENHGKRRWFSGGDDSDSDDDEKKKESLCPKQIQVRLNEFQDLFVEARMCIEDVKDSIGTVYYEDDADDATDAVEIAVRHFEDLIKEITDIDEKNKVLRANGLKVEQLKGELELTLNEGNDHH